MSSPRIERHVTNARLSEMTVHRLGDGGTVYLAGQVAEDASQDIAGQTRQVLAQIDALLAKAGSDKGKLLRVEIILADLADFAAMNALWEAWLPASAAPARATIEAALAKPGWKVEMVVTAAL